MSEKLPEGWEWRTLEDLAAPEPRSITDGPFGSNLKTAHYTESGPRVIRLQNIGDGEYRHEDAHISEEHYAELVQHSVKANDLVVASLGEALPRACLVPASVPPAIVKADCIRVRLRSDVDARYVNYALQRPALRRETATHIKGVGRPRLGLKGIKSLVVPLAPSAEQPKIVATIEEHLARLDAASLGLSTAARRLETFLGAALQYSAEAERVPIGDVLLRSNYGTSSKCDYGGVGPPVLRIPNIQSRRVSLEDLKRAQTVEDVGESAYLWDGDVLVVRTNGSRNLIGRTAVVREPRPSLAFASYLIRLQFDPSRVLPEFASMMLESPRLRQEIEARAASSAGQYNLSLAKIKPLQIPLPTLSEQGSLVDRFLALEEQARRFVVTVRAGEIRSASLRRAILSAAFAGRLRSRYDMEATAA